MKKINKKGITLIVLVTTIMVALILITTIIVSYNSIKQSTRKKEFAREIYTLQKVIEQYEFMNNKYPIKDEQTVNLLGIDSEFRNQFSSEEGFSKNSITLNHIDLYEAGVDNISRGLKYSGENDIYLFSKNTEKVYYLKGEKIGNDIYYTLTDELKKQIELTK